MEILLRRRRPPPSHFRISEGLHMTAPKFKRQLKQLGWSFSEAARELGVPSGRPRIHEWATGKRKIPPYIAAHMKTLAWVMKADAALEDAQVDFENRFGPQLRKMKDPTYLARRKSEEAR